MKSLTVKKLREALEGVPDELEVHFSSDTVEDYEIIIEMARRVKYDLPGGKRFADTGETGVDYFAIYGNAKSEDDDLYCLMCGRTLKGADDATSTSS